MSEFFLSLLDQELDELKSNHRYRSIPTLPAGELNFSSNDYLGLSESKELRDRVLERLKELPLSASSSRLLPGHHQQHERAETVFANFVKGPSALMFNSGYDANGALISTLTTRHDLVLYDERCHASWYDGLRSLHAHSYRFRHNSIEHLESLLKSHASKHRHLFIVVESVYSMDGDLAPLEEITLLASAYQAILIVDEAHATGVCGERGEGLVTARSIRSKNVITVHTCGKALGASGAFVVAEPTIREYLINKARPLIYTTALPPSIAVQIEESVHLLESRGKEMIAELASMSTFVRNVLAASLKKWMVPAGVTPIIPIIVGDNKVAMDAAVYLRTEHCWVAAIRPPTVPQGTSRLRLNVSLRHTKQELEKVIGLLVQAESRFAV